MKRVRQVAQILLWGVAAFWFVFALLSGAGELGGGWRGLLRNSPNAAPWLALLLLAAASHRWPVAAGLLVAAAGAASALFFDAIAHPAVLLGVSLPILALGLTLAAGGWAEGRDGRRPAADK